MRFTDNYFVDEADFTHHDEDGTGTEELNKVRNLFFFRLEYLFNPTGNIDVPPTAQHPISIPIRVPDGNVGYTEIEIVDCAGGRQGSFLKGTERRKYLKDRFKGKWALIVIIPTGPPDHISKIDAEYNYSQGRLFHLFTHQLSWFVREKQIVDEAQLIRSINGRLNYSIDAPLIIVKTCFDSWSTYGTSSRTRKGWLGQYNKAG